ncbi:Coatomer subunit epsilon-2 [Zea mays]|uniref:Coatomer subunit epsilon-2 n=1 Tax=Zea mays TaxID=4577 RepID=A0A1D6H657_MAIZE|nr:Coatomer subunit epsilon-2 [Zea mays]
MDDSSVKAEDQTMLLEEGGQAMAAKPAYTSLTSQILRLIFMDQLLLENRLTLRAISEFGGYLLYFYICDRTNLLGESAKNYSRDLFLFLYFLLIIVAAMTSFKDIKQRDEFICVQREIRRQPQHWTDHAKKQLRVMQQLDEDHTLTQLTNAWVDLVLGGSKIQEARLIFQDLSDKYPTTCTILNGKALCSTHMGNFEDAEGLLLESLNKDAKDTKTLANLTVCSLNLGKPTTRYLNQLKLAHPDHALVKRMSSAVESFDRACQAMA